MLTMSKTMKTLKKLRQQSREEDLMLESTEGQEEVVTLGTNIWEDEYEPIPLSSFISSKQPVDIVQFNPGEIEDTLAPLQMHEANDWLLAEFLKDEDLSFLLFEPYLHFDYDTRETISRIESKSSEAGRIQNLSNKKRKLFQ